MYDVYILSVRAGCFQDLLDLCADHSPECSTWVRGIEWTSGVKIHLECDRCGADATLHSHKKRISEAGQRDCVEFEPRSGGVLPVIGVRGHTHSKVEGGRMSAVLQQKSQALAKPGEHVLVQQVGR